MRPTHSHKDKKHHLKRAIGLMALALVASACVRSSGRSSPTPVFLETERNDDAFEANYFGVLVPGDRFFIDGFITDKGSDPFDGFAFTSNEPIHVDFRLFTDDPFADLDVCLYDPFLDLTVDCFATPANPEVGGVDVTAGGLDFHLVVESFAGASSYSLEIDVYRLYASDVAPLSKVAALDSPSVDGSLSSGLRATGSDATGSDETGSDEAAASALKGADPKAFELYRKSAEEPADARAVWNETIEVDGETGNVSSTVEGPGPTREPVE